METDKGKKIYDNALNYKMNIKLTVWEKWGYLNVKSVTLC